MWSASSVMMHALTGVNALLKMFYTTKEIIGNYPKMNRLENNRFDKYFSFSLTYFDFHAIIKLYLSEDVI
jgi:hypothetical protein